MRGGVGRVHSAPQGNKWKTGLAEDSLWGSNDRNSLSSSSPLPPSFFCKRHRMDGWVLWLHVLVYLHCPGSVGNLQCSLWGGLKIAKTSLHRCGITGVPLCDEPNECEDWSWPLACGRNRHTPKQTPIHPCTVLSGRLVIKSMAVTNKGYSSFIMVTFLVLNVLCHYVLSANLPTHTQVLILVLNNS
jgi:hypothetical protein